MNVESNGDLLVMLLSSDWYFDFWTTIGLNIDEKRRACLQAKCREVVSGFMEGVDQYWNVSFADHRLAETKRRFGQSLDQCKIAGRDVAYIKRVLDLNSNQEEARSIQLMYMATEHIVYGASNTGDGPIECCSGVIRKAYDNTVNDYKDYDEISIASNSAWDSYLASLTPGLITYMADYLVNNIAMFKFLALWRYLSESQPPNKLNEVVEYYRLIANQLFGAGGTVPSWMTNPD